MTILLLDGALRVTIYYSTSEKEYEDNICISLLEDCPKDEKILRADEANVYVTPQQARDLAMALLKAAEESESSASQA